MKGSKKGMELSINIMIMLALGLMVLIVSMLIFTDKIQILSSSSDCTQRGGKCMPSNECDQSRTGFSCENNKHICCINPAKIT